MMSLSTAADCIRFIFQEAKTLTKSRFKQSYFTRKRKLPFENLLRFLISGSKSATQAALDEHFQKEGGEIHMSQQALSKARNKFDHSPFEKAFFALRDGDYNLSSDNSLERFHGFKIFAVDGSSLALPNIKALKEEFGGTGVGATSPTARISIAYDVINDRIVDAAISPLKVDERTHAKNHLDSLSGAIVMEDSLFIYDRGYASVDLINRIRGYNAQFLMRVRRKFSTAIDEAPMGDSRVILNGNLCVRVIKFPLDSGEIETLITNLEDFDISLFQELYFLRWPVEIKYDIVKNKLELPNFTGWTSNVIRQDFWISMMLANIAAIAKTESDAIVKEQRTAKNNKYEYQTNVNTIIASVRSRFADAVFDPFTSRRKMKIDKLINIVAKSVVPIRPNRKVPRKQNHRDVKFHHNKKSNV